MQLNYNVDILHIKRQKALYHELNRGYVHKEIFAAVFLKRKKKERKKEKDAALFSLTLKVLINKPINKKIQKKKKKT